MDHDEERRACRGCGRTWRHLYRGYCRGCIEAMREDVEGDRRKERKQTRDAEKGGEVDHAND